MLEIVDDRGRHTVLFRHGLIVNASSPDHPDLVAWLEKSMAIPSAAAPGLRQMEESGIPSGTAALDLNLIAADDLAEAVRNRSAERGLRKKYRRPMTRRPPPPSPFAERRCAL